MSTQLGCVFRPQFPAGQLAGAARAAEAAGIAELWLWEDCFAHGGIASAAIALASTDSLVVGIGVLPVPLRNVALTAMEINTLEQAFPGRVRVGVGHGVQDWMRQVGVKVGSPLTLLREYVTCLRGLLAGETVTFSGRYVFLDNVRLDWAPNPDIPLLASATGPKTLQLAGEIATGTILTGETSPDEMRAAVEQIRTGVAARGGSQAHDVVVYVPCATDTAGQIGSLIAPYVDAGATTVVLEPSADADILAFLEFVGAEIG